MRFLRNFIRKTKYNLRFLNKNKKAKLNYTVNALTNTKLTELMNNYGSDKGNKDNHHNYSEFYSELFFNNRKKVKNFLEIGLGTNDVSMASNMGKHGSPLASLRAWRDFFKNAIKYLSDDGVYIIEDVYFKDKIKFINYFEKEKFNYSIVDIYHEENIANNCIVLIRKNV
jgi:hypothetical protein